MSVTPDKIDTPAIEDKLDNRGKVDVGKAFKLRVVNHLSYANIGKHFNVSAQAIHQRLGDLIGLLDDPEIARAYEDNKQRILAGGEAILFSDLLDPDKRKAASLNNVAYAYTAVANQARLEAGKSTSNVSLRTAVDGLESKAQEAQELLDKLKGG
jgi:hypothetical protein